MPCHVPDDQMGRMIQAILLPDSWMDRVLARIHLVDEMKWIEHERRKVDQRLRRLGRAYVDGLYSDNDYKREKRTLEERAARLVIPGIDVVREAAKLLEDLPALWDESQPDRTASDLDCDAGCRLCGYRGGKVHRGHPAQASLPTPIRDRYLSGGQRRGLNKRTAPRSTTTRRRWFVFWSRRRRVGCSLFANSGGPPAGRVLIGLG